MDKEDKKTGFTVGRLHSYRNTNPEFVKNGLIMTSEGRVYDIMNVKAEDLDYDHMIRAISQICRFNGGTRVFYSVAQHCIRVSEAILLVTGNVKLALGGLIHDLSEGLMHDIPNPYKQLFPEIKVIEKRLDGLIFERFKIPEMAGHPLIKSVDVNCCDDEIHTMLWKDPDHEVEVGFLMPVEAEIAYIYQLNKLESLMPFQDLPLATKEFSHQD
jgi:uncharacterized protein